MEILTKAPRGTSDVLPGESYLNQFVESSLLEIADNYGFSEIRTPVFEHTELFNRSVGETTDVVQKEMYTFNDNGGRSITLKPEGTAGAVRLFIEHGLFNEPQPMKMCYVTPCYRYEKPQAGRLREFHQFGVEVFGAGKPEQDAEIIALANRIFDFFGVSGIKLKINSIGCPECRKNYQNALREYFTAHIDDLCETCRGRLERNPMRILDCKSPVCHELSKGAPIILDYLCDECNAHFDGVKNCLDALSIPYEVDPSIVRGLDYYTRTVFEFVSDCLGAQSTVLGGGRYDGLVEELGGPATPACGFAMGLERFMMVLKAQECDLPKKFSVNLYIGSMGDKANVMALKLSEELREAGMSCLFDTVGRGLKAQMKYANKIGAQYSCVLGDNEISEGKVKVKCMENGEETELAFENFADDFMQLNIRQTINGFGSDDLNFNI